MAQHSRLQTLQAGRGIAALLVVVCHASAFAGQEPTLWHRQDVYAWLRGGALGVQLFFVLSGIVIFSAHRNDIGRPSSLPSFLWKRFRRIYPLYWIFFVLTLLRHTAVPDANPNFQRGAWVIVSGFALVHIFSTQTIMVVAWTLFDEVLFYLFFSTLLLNKKVGAFCFILWLGASFFFLTPSASYWSSIFSPNHLLFALGMLVAWMLKRGRLPYANSLFAYGAVIFLSCVILDGHLTQGGMAVRLMAGVGAACALFGAAEMERRGKWPVPNWLAFLGNASYSIYLAHFMVVSSVARFCYSRWGQLPVPIGFWVALLILCGTGAGILTYLFVERPLMKMLGKNG